MRHLIHTCLIAVRLVASANSIEREGQFISFAGIITRKEPLELVFEAEDRPEEGRECGRLYA